MSETIPPHPHERVTDPGYFQRVRDNMEWVPEGFRCVWFGILGDGHSPHYQTGWTPGHPQAQEVRRFDGRNHGPYHASPLRTFNPDNLAGPYSWADVMTMSGKATP